MSVWKRRLDLAALGYCMMGFCEQGLERSVPETLIGRQAYQLTL
jgi:hypothetical protein